MKSWIHEISESYVSTHKPVRRDLKENYASLTEEQQFNLLSENVLNYLDEQLQNAFGFGWDDLTENRKKSILKAVTFGVLGRDQVPSSRQFGGASPEDRMHDMVDADDNPSTEDSEQSAYRWTEQNPAPKAKSERGILGRIKQSLVGASRREEDALTQARTERSTGPEKEADTPDTRPERRTVNRDVKEWQPERRTRGQFNFNKLDDDPDEYHPAGWYPTGKREPVDQYRDQRTGEWRDGIGGGQAAKKGRRIGSGHGMRGETS